MFPNCLSTGISSVFGHTCATDYKNRCRQNSWRREIKRCSICRECHQTKGQQKAVSLQHFSVDKPWFTVHSQLSVQLRVDTGPLLTIYADTSGVFLPGLDDTPQNPMTATHDDILLAFLSTGTDVKVVYKCATSVIIGMSLHDI